ncbi:carbamoyl-phosphate synthase (glutamine-hydrolyzing) large subunit [Pseudobacteriovorax antillogorgiicola]|nr:carbamoyl-phosphate synthase (glutamine-hydrolyzing) large subunit [Pseudobacteriovorax antillogorgiicola]
MIKELASLGRAPKVLLLGSGGLSIGQAGEFDYSGTQAIKAMKEEGIHVVVINPNIATVQTNPEEGTKVYLYPVELEWVEKVIAIERPDAIIAGFGGQTALNCLMELDDAGILEKYQVRNLGTPAAILRMTEDRDEFAQKMKSINMPVPASFACNTVDEALEAADKVGYPVILRAAYALGGLGSGFANDKEELQALAQPALASSPQVLIEKSLKGWKEVEYEVMRDSEGNTITICNMENFDPLGIHTGDSIVVCPSQSLSDDEYQILRNAALKIVDSLGIIGECNVQYALDPHSLEFYIIEVNARLSRSSALASKASGYPIAYIAAKVVLGYDLLELKNPVTGITYSFFEPALDYVTIKMPRWDLLKFQGVSHDLGSTMKSVGEVMSIGRTFPEALQKATRMVTEIAQGLSMLRPALNDDELSEALSRPTDTRLYAVIEALRRGWSIDQVHDLTGINQWFLYQTKRITDAEAKIGEIGAKIDTSFEAKPFVQQAFLNTSEDTWRQWKLLGFGDEQIAAIAFQAAGKEVSGREIQQASLAIRKLRIELGIRPVVKKIDTTAGEYPSPSNYLYLSYGGVFDDPLPDDNKVFSAVVLGGGSYRIGTSVEFDWCAVSCSRKLQESGWRSIIVNCNPETVSTDYNSSDRLYFEELSLERILDICDFERPVGVVASMGGQLPNRLANPLSDAGIKLLGHRPDTIDTAEDRSRFSALLDELNIGQPRWIAARTQEEVNAFVDKVGFPILVRPSYVLSGAAMNVAYDADSLNSCLAEAVDLSPDHPVVISEFVEGAREIELDGVAKEGEILTAIVSEHVENAGVHSGDATMVVPAQKLYVETVRRVRRAGRKIAKGLRLNGPFNMQFLAKEGEIKVIECNARAARSFPFVSKAVGLNLADVATDVMIGGKPNLSRFNEDDLDYVGVKAAMFSFKRLGGADPILGVEMASTGEVGCIGEDFDSALLLALEASGVHRPKKGVLVSSGSEKEKLRFLPAAQTLQKLGMPLYATKGTAQYLREHNIEVTALDWPGEGDQDVIKAIKEGLVDFVINIPKSSQRKELTRGSQIRQAAVRFGCSLLTNMEKVTAFVQALDRCEDFVAKHELLVLPDYRA